MKKLLALLVLLCTLVTFAACQGTQTESNPEENLNSPTSTASPTPAAVVVSLESFPENTVIQVETIKDDTRVKSILTTAQSVEVYDINAMLNDEKVQPNEEVEVAFPIPEGYDSDKHIIEVYYISDDGTSEKIDTVIADNIVIAKVMHFSVYAVAIVEKPTFNLAVDAQFTVVDGQKALTSDTNLTLAYNPGETWRAFAEKNKDAGFSVDKDFYGNKDIVYYDYEGTRYQIVTAINLREIAPDEEIIVSDYACLLPHRETLQGQWFYEVENGPFYREDGSLDWFDRQGKTIIIDIPEQTYVIKFIRLAKITANSYTIDEQIIASGKYTSSDGDNLGSTLTLDNGYVLETTRSDSYIATVKIGDKNFTADAQYNFYGF